MSSEGKPAASRDGERRATILRAAIDVFATKGYHGCRIADVAKEAGVAYGLVYHYFRNKDELLASVFDVAWGGFTSRIRAAVEGPGRLTDRIAAAISVGFDAYKIDPRGVRVLLVEVARSPAGSVNRPSVMMDTLEIVRQLFVRAHEEGELDVKQDALLCSALLWGAVEMGLTTLVMMGLDEGQGGSQTEAIDRAKHQVIAAFLRGILPDPANKTLAPVA